MNNDLMFSSASGEWSTPKDFFDKLDAEFHFTLDPCATKLNAKCKRFFTKREDGLKKPWRGRVFVNPPYGRGVDVWVRKAWESAGGGANRSDAAARAHRHGLVARLLHERRDSIPTRPAEVRRA